VNPKRFTIDVAEDLVTIIPTRVHHSGYVFSDDCEHRRFG
jgi:hypothetical protein